MSWFKWPFKNENSADHSVEDALLLKTSASLVPLRAKDVFYFAESYEVELGASRAALHPIPKVEWSLVATRKKDKEAEKQGVAYLPMKEGYFLPVVKASPRLQQFLEYYEANSRAGAFGMGEEAGGLWGMGWRPYWVTMPDGKQQESVRQVTPFFVRDVRMIEKSDREVESLAQEFIQRFDVEFDFPTRTAEETQALGKRLSQQAGESDEDYVYRVLEQTGETMYYDEISVRVSA